MVMSDQPTQASTLNSWAEDKTTYLRSLCAVCRLVVDPTRTWQQPVEMPNGKIGLVYGHEACIVGEGEE